ncbi:MAG: di-trans,poly-cis-decaprenylcistransferase [Eubacterium sp.]|nr:di-trans,poly-cis-decaprenylcistransferase [Eubacterium sp.]
MEKLPNHIAIILDGNGRWAKRRGMPRSYGHIVGTDTLERMCNHIADLGVRYLTVYAFSTENWKRAEDEVRTLMNLFRKYLKRIEKSAHKRHMRVRIIGDKTGLPEDLQERIAALEAVTRDYDKMDFQIALNYGGRDEIARAMTRLAADAKAGLLDDALAGGKLGEDILESYLDTAGIPDPDLLIRTGGEQRISNFLLWQMAYTEYYFTDVAWPAFNEAELQKAIDYYNGRERRFGDAK